MTNANLFGTDGIRSKVGQMPLIPNDLINLGKAICLWAQSKNKSPKIIIATDTRISGSLIKNLLKSGILSYESTIYDAEILPTPAIYYLVQNQKKFNLGIMITASHNPYHDNGIKIIDQSNDKLTKNDELKISEIFYKNNFPVIDYENIGTDIQYAQAKEKYINNFNNFFEKDFLSNTKIVIDCANGATSDLAPKIFRNFGAEVIAINDKSDGKNINKNCGSTKPIDLQKTVIKQHADIGFAFDGDGDRIVAVNQEGSIKDGDDILALLSDNPIYESHTIVSTIMSNYGLELLLKNKNKTLIRTPVGDKFISQGLIQNNLLLGGEQSGHIILRDYLNSSDGIFTALRILQHIKRSNNMPMYTFTKLPQLTINMPIDSRQNLNAAPYATIINNWEQKLQPGRLIVRYSGTEPYLRIMVETTNLDEANRIATELSQELKIAFSKGI